ncbi:DUF2285 domain-containing protein [Aurantiacibacter flavus]|uniref:DUF2285 domain-containing protein n=1 Tax=Aurantiacibacter flavus TaxID=3145232 RepID=A0ABV0CX86_9SPHN
MPPERDWRTPPDEARDEALQYSDIAVGYLSRNANYRTEYRRAIDRVKRGAVKADDATAALVRRWGISFHTDPSAAFDPKLTVARPDLSPTDIVLAPALSGIAAKRLDPKSLGEVRACITIGEFRHFILADKDGDEHLWVAGSFGRPLAMMLPFGPDPLVRLASAERFCRRLLGMAAGPPPLRPTQFRRHHLLTLLQVLDGHHAGATRRELAAALIDRDVRDYSAADWNDSRERKRISRWIKDAVELRDGGYIRLLRGG